MTRLLYFGLAIVIGWKSYGYFQMNYGGPEVDEASVVVYGRKSCGYTTKTMARLQASGVPYVFQSVDNSAAANTLHANMQNQGLSVRRYLLPMVETNGRLAERPHPDVVIKSYRKLERELASEA